MFSPGYGVRGAGSFDMRPRMRTGTGMTTVHGRARSSMASECTRWGRKGSCIAWSLDRGSWVWKRTCAPTTRCGRIFFGTASTPLVEGKLLIVNVGAPGGPCVAGLEKATAAKRGAPVSGGVPVTRHQFRR